MRVAVVGVGAMGTLIGHGLCQSKHEVVVIDTPSRIAQIHDAGGLVLKDTEGHITTRNPALATDNYQQVGRVDVVILATKSHVLPCIAPHLAQITGPDTLIVPIQNGIPWWYLYNLSGQPSRCSDTRIQCLDPQGLLHTHINIDQVVGCVAYPAAMMDDNGLVTHVEGVRFPVGELDGNLSARAEMLTELFTAAGFKSRLIQDIRSEIWLKCLGALSINPVSALTRASMVDICTFADTHDLIRQMMQEAQQVAHALGAKFRHTIEKRIAGAQAVGAHKTSTLQDVECGRSIELDAVMLSVLELAERVAVATPTIRTLYACMALLNKNLLQNERVAPGQVLAS